MRRIFYLSIFLLTGCIYHHSFVAKPYRDNKPVAHTFRLDGAWYRVLKENVYDATIKNYTVADVLAFTFFYQDGISLDGGATARESGISTAADSIRSMIRHAMAPEGKWPWIPDFGGFTCTGDSITIQVMRYVPEFAFENYTLSGKVIDDSTIYITRFVFKPRPYLPSYQTPYSLHFIRTEKPDSLKGNRWSKRGWYWRSSGQ